MINSTVRAALRVAAVLYALVGVVAGAWGIIQASGSHDVVVGVGWQHWMMIVSAVVGPLVQAGVLWTLLSIDERISNRGQ